jgi:hypothetical protein
VTRTAGGRLLWFEFGGETRPGTARLTVYRADGVPLREVDLLGLSGYATADEARRKIVYNDVLVRDYQNWLPLDAVREAYPSGGREELEIRDERGRIVLRIDGDRVEVRRLTGLAARRPKEAAIWDEKVLSERVFDSPNGRFRLRERRIEGKVNGDFSLTTLLTKAEDADGRPRYVELWSNRFYQPILQARVVDSGRAFYVRPGPSEPGGPLRAALCVTDADGAGLGGLTVGERPLDLPAVTPATLAALDLAGMRRTVGGEVRRRQVEGLTLFAPVRETYRLPLGDGRVWEFSIAPLPKRGPEARLWWRRVPFRPSAGRGE